MFLRFYYVLLTSALVASLSAASAEAQASPTLDSASAGVGVRYGTDNLGLGFGARGGYTLSPGLYLGGLFDFHLGGQVSNDFGRVDYAFWGALVEVGYDLPIVESLVVRPAFLLGAMGVVRDCPEFVGPVSCEDDTGLEAAIGAQLFYAIDIVTIGPELRLMFGNWDSLVAGLNVGVIL